MVKRALISGITGQDGSYLAELLLDKGYEVHGIVRRVAIGDSSIRLWRIEHLLDRLHLHSASMESLSSIVKVFQAVQPEECYHLAAQSFVADSFEDEFSTYRINVDGTHHVLSALRDFVPGCRFYFAGSSEMFGNAVSDIQDEQTPMHPRSVYGISKLAGFHLTRHYREAYGIHASTGILYNHESPRRGKEFVTRKITDGVARIKYGLAKTLKLGNLQARRDWGYAGDYVQAMWLMLQQDCPDDYVVATGESHSVEECLEIAFGEAGLRWQEYVEQDEALMRPSEIHVLRGDASKARRALGWEPRIVPSFPMMIEWMVRADCERYATKGVKE